MKIAKQMELLTSLGNNMTYAQKSFRKKLAFRMKCCGSVKINQKQKGKRKEKVTTFLLLKARRYKGVAPNQLRLSFIQMVPPTGSGGQNRLRTSQRKETEARRFIPELAATLHAYVSEIN